MLETLDTVGAAVPVDIIGLDVQIGGAGVEDHFATLQRTGFAMEANGCNDCATIEQGEQCAVFAKFPVEPETIGAFAHIVILLALTLIGTAESILDGQGYVALGLRSTQKLMDALTVDLALVDGLVLRYRDEELVVGQHLTDGEHTIPARRRETTAGPALRPDVQMTVGQKLLGALQQGAERERLEIGLEIDGVGTHEWNNMGVLAHIFGIEG